MTPRAEARIRAAMGELTEALVAALDGQPQAGAPDRLLSIREASQLLGIGRSLLYAEIGRGRIRSVSVGRRRLIPAAAVADHGRPSGARK